MPLLCRWAGRQNPFRGAEAAFHGLSDHGDSPVALGYGGRCSCYSGRASSTVAGYGGDTHAPTVAARWTSPDVVDIPVVTQRPFHVVQPVWRTTEIPQSLFDKVIDVPGVKVCEMVGPGLTRAIIWAEKGWRVAGNLTPRWPATRIHCQQLCDYMHNVRKFEFGIEFSNRPVF